MRTPLRPKKLIAIGLAMTLSAILSVGCGKKQPSYSSSSSGGSDPQTGEQKASPTSTSISPAADPAAPQTRKSEQAMKPEPPRAQCFEVTYKHKKSAGRMNEDEFLRHKNVITLPIESGEKLNSKSVCVRVNGKPVAFKNPKGKSKTNELMLEAFVGPKAVITARYCVGSAKCNEPCKVPRDEFMDAIGGGGLDTGAAAADDWGSGNGQQEQDDAQLRAELKGLKDAFAGAEKARWFKDWDASPATPALSCGQAVARKEQG